MNFIAIRGATTVIKNTSDEILNNTKDLILEMEENNNINRQDVVSIIFTSTADLNKVYPAKAARQLGYIKAGLMCLDEMYVENSLGKCIRIMILCNSKKRQEDVKHIYLKGAKVLRPDLI